MEKYEIIRKKIIQLHQFDNKYEYHRYFINVTKKY